jgi:glycosyltransferase 2 family protein
MPRRSVHRRAWRIAQIVFGVVIVVVAGRSILHNWSQMRTQPVRWHVVPGFIVAALLVTWVMYALLVQAWRIMLTGWGERLAMLPAARIWTVSSLGKYVPGQVWAIASMAVMSQRVGVAPWAATASSVLLQGLAVGTGACVVGVSGSSLTAAYPEARWILAVLVGLSISGVALIMWQPFIRKALSLLRVDTGGARAPALDKVLFGALANAVAWIGYGVALWLLARGLFDVPALTIPRAVGAFTAAYLAGFLAFGLPAGVGVREVVFVSVLQSAIGTPTALALAFASRLLLTVAEFGAAAPFLLSSPERVRAQP